MEYIRELHFFVQANGWEYIKSEQGWIPFLEWVQTEYPNADLIEKAMEIINNYQEN
jgi:hypothetical protein